MDATCGDTTLLLLKCLCCMAAVCTVQPQHLTHLFIFFAKGQFAYMPRQLLFLGMKPMSMILAQLEFLYNKFVLLCLLSREGLIQVTVGKGLGKVWV